MDLKLAVCIKSPQDFLQSFLGSFEQFNPSNAEATFIQSTRTQTFKKKTSKPCLVGIHWIALAEDSQVSTHVSGFQSLFNFFASFCIGQISHHQHRG